MIRDDFKILSLIYILINIIFVIFLQFLYRFSYVTNLLHSLLVFISLGFFFYVGYVLLGKLKQKYIIPLSIILIFIVRLINLLLTYVIENYVTYPWTYLAKIDKYYNVAMTKSEYISSMWTTFTFNLFAFEVLLIIFVFIGLYIYRFLHKS